MRLFIATACLVSLAACAGHAGRQEAAVGARPAAEPAAVAPQRTPVPEPRPAVPRKPSGTGKSSAAASAEQDQSGAGIPSASIPKPPVDMDTLAGVDRLQLESILGPADEVRDQPPGEVWIYREGGCSVELYLFPQISASQYAVLGHKFLPSSLPEEERTACLTKLASRTRAS